MKRVLKHGNRHHSVMTCPGCECEFEYSNEDVFVHKDTVSITCPECSYICEIREASQDEVECDKVKGEKEKSQEEFKPGSIVTHANYPNRIYVVVHGNTDGTFYLKCIDLESEHDILSATPYFITLLKKEDGCNLLESEQWKKYAKIVSALNSASKGNCDYELKKGEEPRTLDKDIDLYYFSYGSGNGYFENLSLPKFRDIVHTFVDEYSKK